MPLIIPDCNLENKENSNDDSSSISSRDLMNTLVPPTFCTDCLVSHTTNVLCKYAKLGRGLTKYISGPNELV